METSHQSRDLGSEPRSLEEHLASTPSQLTVPAETRISVITTQQLSAIHNHVGDDFTGELAAPLSSTNGDVVFPIGTAVQGYVAAVKLHGIFRREGYVLIQLRQIGGHEVTTNTYPTGSGRELIGANYEVIRAKSIVLFTLEKPVMVTTANNTDSPMSARLR